MVDKSMTKINKLSKQAKAMGSNHGNVCMVKHGKHNEKRKDSLAYFLGS